jgi:hypothetical protein
MMVEKNGKTVAWFSAGVSSAVATKLMISEIDEIIYTHIEDQHEDTMRFVKDCEQWFGKEIQILQSEYRTVENVVDSTRYVNGPAGAACTRILKKRVRQDWEKTQDLFNLTYVWGMDLKEAHRAERVRQAMPEQTHEFPLIDKSISKEHAHRILKASGIARPAPYEMGLHNNNCWGCLKGGMGYWNLIRVLTPSKFWERAAMERRVGRSIINGVFLDELDPEAGRHAGPIVDDCGIFCELEALS